MRQHSALEVGGEVFLDEAGQPTLLRALQTRVRQVLGNILSNALKFTAQGEVVLRARNEPSGHWTFEVTDSGIGMTPQTLAALFTPFKQADASISRRFGGTGLGLALAKRPPVMRSSP